MKSSLVLTILGPDEVGLVEALADAVAEHGGSWQESRMARLAGQFAGILRVECQAEKRAQLEEDLQKLKIRGLTVMVAHDQSTPENQSRTLSLEVTGHDEPGIVKRVSATLAGLGVNVEELETTLESAPMSGHALFRACGAIRLPESLGKSDLIEALENVGAGLTVDVQASGD